MSETERSPRTAARLAEVVAALCVATDMGTGKPPGRGLRVSLVALRLAELMGLPEAERSRVYYTSLLAMLGCTAQSSPAAAVFGDEIAFGTMFAPLVNAPRAEMMGYLLRNYAADERFARRLRRVFRLMTAGRTLFAESSSGHCEVAQRLARRLGVDESVIEPLGAVFERWDGSGSPRALRGDQVPIAVRVAHVAWDVETFGCDGGVEAWTAVLRRRSDRTVDPAVVDVAVRSAADIDEALRVASPWDALLAAEPGTPRIAGDADAVASVIGDFVDLKSDHLAGHSRAVAAIAAAAAAGLRHAAGERRRGAPRRLGARSRPHRRVDEHLGQARPAQRCGVGDGAAAPLPR